MFNVDKFMNSSFVPREEEIKLGDEFKPFFPDGEPCVIKVRGLSGVELAQVHNAVDKHKNLAGLVEGLLSDVDAVKLGALKQAIGIEKGTPAETAKRIELFVRGVISPPKPTPALAAKFCEKFPIDFYHITNKISRLTGEGCLLGKPKPSGGKKK